mmetsp:Transcript_5588/g.6036  ORF Transcript_5588/g.6036 Transcript_5588/m.6036 type:complete len:157 (+) Transcript_5588:55-525(+)
MSLEQHLQVFDLHDTQIARQLPKCEIANILRTCGRIATPNEMQILLQGLPEVVTRTEFAELVSSMKPGPRDTDLFTAMQAFDHKESGSLSKVEVTTIVSQMNEKVSANDVNLLLKSLPFDSEDRISIDTLVRKLLTPHRAIQVPLQEVSARMQRPQ